MSDVATSEITLPRKWRPITLLNVDITMDINAI